MDLLVVENGYDGSGLSAMRFLVVADLHFNLRQFAWIERQAPRFGAIVFAGDLLDMSGHHSYPDQLHELGALLARLRAQTHVLVASGNHDLGDAAGERWREVVAASGCFVDGDTVVFDQAAITLCPWQEEPTAESVLARLLAAAPAPVDRPWIWVHHEPPAGAAVSRNGRRAGGNGGLAQLVRRLQPALVLSGHVHEAPFVAGGGWIDRMAATWLVNPGRQPGEVPAHVVLDLDGDRACWSALGVREDRHLGLRGRPTTAPLRAGARMLG